MPLEQSNYQEEQQEYEEKPKSAEKQ